jgi:hypothetical protein
MFLELAHARSVIANSRYEKEFEQRVGVSASGAPEKRRSGAKLLATSRLIRIVSDRPPPTRRFAGAPILTFAYLLSVNSFFSLLLFAIR